jgi:hypothetical protein
MATDRQSVWDREAGASRTSDEPGLRGRSARCTRAQSRRCRWRRNRVEVDRAGEPFDRWELGVHCRARDLHERPLSDWGR